MQDVSHNITVDRLSQEGLAKCKSPDNPKAAAYADMLVLNITLDRGLYNTQQQDDETIKVCVHCGAFPVLEGCDASSSLWSYRDIFLVSGFVAVL